MPDRTIKYFVPGYSPSALEARVSNDSAVIRIIENLVSMGGEKLTVLPQVAYLPKDVALKIDPVHDLYDRFLSITSHLQYLEADHSFLSLELCNKDERKVQFFIRYHPDQPEFIPPGAEHDHARIIQHALSTKWSPSSSTKSFSAFKGYQSRYPVHIGRPVHCTGPPIIIYEQIFADIMDDLAHLSDRPHNEDILAKIGELAAKSVAIYATESGREEAVYPLIEILLDIQLARNASASSLPTAAKSDAIALENSAIYLHLECKNELGLGGIADFQGALTFLKHAAGPGYAEIRSKTCCPCIRVSIAGPYISFSGSVLTDTYSLQSFTNYVYLGGDVFMTSNIYNTARIFDVFRNALRKMRERYKELEYVGLAKKDPSRLFPRPAYLPNTSIPNLVFERRLIPDKQHQLARRALFHAKYNEQRVVVKFCENYDSSAHRKVAGKGLAPCLHAHTRLRGGVHMVVMDYIDGLDAHHQFSDKELPSSVIQQVESALAILHSSNLVHGDIRRLNILVTRKTHHNPTSPGSEAAMDVDMPWLAYLIDFDYVGEANKDRYSPLLNTTIPWPQGVRPGGLMETKHDEVMLRTITRAGSHAYSVSPYISARLG